MPITRQSTFALNLHSKNQRQKIYIISLSHGLNNEYEKFTTAVHTEYVKIYRSKRIQLNILIAYSLIYNSFSANSAKRLLTTPSKLNVALPEKFLNFSTI